MTSTASDHRSTMMKLFGGEQASPTTNNNTPVEVDDIGFSYDDLKSDDMNDDNRSNTSRGSQQHQTTPAAKSKSPNRSTEKKPKYSPGIYSESNKESSKASTMNISIGMDADDNDDGLHSTPPNIKVVSHKANKINNSNTGSGKKSFVPKDASKLFDMTENPYSPKLASLRQQNKPQGTTSPPSSPTSSQVSADSNQPQRQQLSDTDTNGRKHAALVQASTEAVSKFFAETASSSQSFDGLDASNELHPRIASSLDSMHDFENNRETRNVESRIRLVKDKRAANLQSTPERRIFHEDDDASTSRQFGNNNFSPGQFSNPSTSAATPSPMPLPVSLPPNGSNTQANIGPFVTQQHRSRSLFKLMRNQDIHPDFHSAASKALQDFAESSLSGYRVFGSGTPVSEADIQRAERQWSNSLLTSSALHVAAMKSSPAGDGSYKRTPSVQSGRSNSTYAHQPSINTKRSSGTSRNNKSSFERPTLDLQTRFVNLVLGVSDEEYYAKLEKHHRKEERRRRKERSGKSPPKDDTASSFSHSYGFQAKEQGNGSTEVGTGRENRTNSANTNLEERSDNANTDFVPSYQIIQKVDGKVVLQCGRQEERLVQRMRDNNDKANGVTGASRTAHSGTLSSILGIDDDMEVEDRSQFLTTARELSAKHFLDHEEISFIPEGYDGMTKTPPHKLNLIFNFKNYMDDVFRIMRGISGIHEADYLFSITGDFNTIEFLPNTKSGQFYYYSHDGKYLIKSLTNQESKVLRKLMPSYVDHIARNPDSLLTRYYGLHRLRIPSRKFQVYLVVMSSVMATDLPIHVKYDLKGSTHGRWVRPADCDAGMVQKDINFRETGRKMYLGKQLSMEFSTVVRKDAEYLKSQNIMNYSFLVGIYEVGTGKPAKRYAGVTLATEVTQRISTLQASPPSVQSNEPGRLFTACRGGVHSSKRASTDANTKLGSEVYFFGIVDFLQEYNVSKWAGAVVTAHLGGAVRHDISVIDPASYSERFINFVTQCTDYAENFRDKSIPKPIKESPTEKSSKSRTNKRDSSNASPAAAAPSVPPNSSNSSKSDKASPDKQPAAAINESYVNASSVAAKMPKPPTAGRRRSVQEMAHLEELEKRQTLGIGLNNGLGATGRGPGLYGNHLPGPKVSVHGHNNNNNSNSKENLVDLSTTAVSSSAVTVTPSFGQRDNYSSQPVRDPAVHEITDWD